MKKLLLILTFLTGISSFSQEEPREVTPEIMAKLKVDIEAEIPAVKKKWLELEELSDKQLEYAVDTFRIEQLSKRRMDIDYSTVGMKDAMSELIDGYDVLLNKYYNLLMKELKTDDKQTLKTAQKAWLAYRDAERELIWTMKEDEYSGGGTIQGLFGMSEYLDLIQTRTEALFYYYESIMIFE